MQSNYHQLKVMKNSLTKSLNLSIDVSLCSNVTRRKIKTNVVCSYPGFSTSNIETDTRNNLVAGFAAIDSAGVDSTTGSVQPSGNLCTRLVSPPTWAVSARGESRLEPVGDSLLLHGSIDLTNRPFYRVGRSEGCDITLFHPNSSRQHALIFHHPNGSCYVLDCGSAQGTFVNGVKLQSSSTDAGNNLFFPLRVKNGSLIRFGGSGCPTYILKSFTQGIDSFVEEETIWTNQRIHRSDSCGASNIDKTGLCSDDDISPVSSSQLKYNTRVNAVGSYYKGNAQSHIISESDAGPLFLNTDKCPKPFQLKKRPLTEYDLAQLCSKSSTIRRASFPRLKIDDAIHHFTERTIPLEPSEDVDTEPSKRLSLIETNDGSALSRQMDMKRRNKQPKHVQFSDETPSFIHLLAISPNE